MRKVTTDIVQAFINHEPRTVGNSSTHDNALLLHGNRIAEWRGRELWITNAGWFSSTTKERLNGLPGISISQRKGVWYLNEKAWDGGWIKIS